MCMVDISVKWCATRLNVYARCREGHKKDLLSRKMFIIKVNEKWPLSVLPDPISI